MAGGQRVRSVQTTLAFVRQYRAAHGVSPSVREVAAHLGYRSSSDGLVALRAAESAGVLCREGKGRSTQYVPVVPDGHCHACGQRLPEGS